MKLRLKDLTPIVARVLGLCETDTHLLDIINRAYERLMLEGNWKGTTCRYRICTIDSCLTWPREIATILAWAKTATPGYLRNDWYEFLDYGPGVMQEHTIMTDTMIDRGMACAFDDVRGTGKKLQIYSDVTESASSYVILRFYDENGQYVRTQFGGSWIDGEKLLLPAAGAYATTTNYCTAGGLVEVIKSVTNGTIRLYEYDTVAATRKPLGYYQPDEEIPSYRRSEVVGLGQVTDADNKVQITAMVKKAFLPVAGDDDILLIEHRDALKLACMAVDKEDKGLIGEAQVYWYGGADERSGARIVGAVPLLQRQLADYRGRGNHVPIRFADTGCFGALVRRIR